MKLVFATRNRGKLRELGELTAGQALTVVSLDDVAVPPVEEDAPTFAGNAEKKARAAFAATGLPALADDSGLEVDALGGAPGVRSARYSGDHDDARNNAALLAALDGVPDARRAARFRCALAFVDGDAPALLAEGACEGRIAHAPRGAQGFGYDPLFLVDGAGGRTMAELAPDEKNAVSHRGRALRAMVAALTLRGVL
jgi:XTP/dITP diphosphohydrolase